MLHTADTHPAQQEFDILINNKAVISFSNSDGLSFDENLNPEEYNQLAEFFKSINIKYKNKKNNAKKDVYFKNLQNKRAEKYNL
jgi:hypothetical protein